MELLVFGMSCTMGVSGEQLCFPKRMEPMGKAARVGFAEPWNHWGWINNGQGALSSSGQLVNVALPLNSKDNQKPWEGAGKYLILQFLKGLEKPLALGLPTCSANRNSAALLEVSYLKPVWKTGSWSKALRKRGLLDKSSMKYLPCVPQACLL